MSHRRPLVLNNKKIPSELPIGDTAVIICRSGAFSTIGAAASYSGELFVASDTNELYRSNGTTWDKIGSSGSGVVESIQEGTGISVDSSSPTDPIVGLAQMPTKTVKGNNTGSTGDAANLTTAQLAAMFGTPTGSKFLADDGTLKTAGGSGDMVKAAANKMTWEKPSSSRGIDDSFLCVSNPGNFTGISLMTYEQSGFILGGTEWNMNTGKITHAAYAGYDFCTGNANWSSPSLRILSTDLRSFVTHYFDVDIVLKTAGSGIKIKEGSDATSGVATLVGGTVTVNTSKVTANSRIQLTGQNLGTITVPVGYAVSARTPGTSFTILSANVLDTSDVAWVIIEPAP